MKLIFLDIDGVMNSWFSEVSKKHESLAFDEGAVESLMHIIRETNARIVVSSTWRIGETVETLKNRIFSYYDLDQYVIGVTPELLEETRGKEIKSYLSCLDLAKLESFVIIDDDRDMDDLMGHLVRTKPKYGLTKNEAKEAIKILNK